MTQQRANPRAQALARLCENLAYALPPYRDMLHDQLRHLTGYPDHTPGAAPATVQASKPLEGRCTANVALGPFTPSAAPLLMDCGRSRPCPEHDRPVTLTPTEHTANQRQQLKAELADIDQVLDTVVYLVNELLQRARRHAPPDKITVALCRDGQTGKDGTIEWGDTTCTDASDKAGLCSRHYMAWYRWRKARGADTGRMFEPPAVTGHDLR